MHRGDSRQMGRLTQVTGITQCQSQLQPRKFAVNHLHSLFIFFKEREKRKAAGKTEIAVNYSLLKLRDDASQVWRHCINDSSNQGNAGWQLANVGSGSPLKNCHFTLFRQENSNVHVEKKERGRGKNVSSRFLGKAEGGISPSLH